jgi:hypothetical protein
MALAATARSFEDIAELDFRRPDKDPDEIEIAACVDMPVTAVRRVTSGTHGE